MYTSPLDGTSFHEPARYGGDGDPGPQLIEHYDAEHRGKSRPALETRRAQIISRTAELESYTRRSQAQASELDDLIAEQIVVDDLIKRDDVLARRSQIQKLSRMAQDPANLERPQGAPALVKGLGDRLETPQEAIQRAGNPWRDEGGPLDRESGAGYVSRAHTAIEAMSERLSHDGSEKLAGLLSLRPSTFETTYEIRNREDIRRSAEFVLALSNPFYESAFRHILRHPMEFTGGTGHLMWSDEERRAYTDVMACRATLIEDTGTGGQYILPLYLDPSIILSNAGAASPWRGFCRTVTTTSNTYNFATSAGTTANWLAEATVSTDTTPVIAQGVITPRKLACFITSSFEEIADSDFGTQVPMLVADARGRLEEAAFVTGNGTTQPKGTVTAATVDGNTGLLTVANAVAQFSLLANLPVRFRTGDARPAWVANILVINAMRALTAFTAATESIVDDSTSPPKMFGYPLYESTTMDGVLTTGGHKGLLFMDGNSYLIVDRLGTTVIYDPLVSGTGGILPAGIAGWFAYARVGADAAVPTALRVHSTT
jgi:HK97 family phage major capsid protein